MKSERDNEGIDRRGLTRRELLQAGAVVGAGGTILGSALLGAGCGSSDGGGGGASASPSSSAAAGTAKAGGTFTLATDQLFPKDSLDTLTNTTDGVDALEGMIREGLVTYDFAFTPQPRLAESWEVNADATEYTFHLRQGVTWHDGTPFTAKDVESSLQRILDPDNGSGMNDRLLSSFGPNDVQVVDDATVTLKLKRPDSLLLLALSNQQCYLTKARRHRFRGRHRDRAVRAQVLGPGAQLRGGQERRLLDARQAVPRRGPRRERRRAVDEAPGRGHRSVRRHADRLRPAAGGPGQHQAQDQPVREGHHVLRRHAGHGEAVERRARARGDQALPRPREGHAGRLRRPGVRLARLVRGHGRPLHGRRPHRAARPWTAPRRRSS